MIMQNIKNANGKLICKVDSDSKVIEIVFKGYKTIIQFFENGKMQVINEEK